MEPIKDIIPQVIANISQKKPETQEKIQRLWYSMVGEQAKEHTAMAEFKDKRLTVHVDSPAWLFQMNVKKRKILERLKEEWPDLQNIHFKIGKVK